MDKLKVVIYGAFISLTLMVLIQFFRMIIADNERKVLEIYNNCKGAGVIEASSGVILFLRTTCKEDNTYTVFSMPKKSI